MGYDWINAFQDVARMFREMGQGHQRRQDELRQKELDEERKRQERMQALSFITNTMSNMRSDPSFATSPAGMALTQSALDLGKQYGITSDEIGAYSAGAMQNQPSPVMKPTAGAMQSSVNPEMMPASAPQAMQPKQKSIPQEVVSSPFNTQFNLNAKPNPFTEQFDLGAAMSPKPKVDLTQKRPNEFLVLSKIDKMPSMVSSPALGDLGEMTPQQFVFSRASRQIPSDARMSTPAGRLSVDMLDPRTRQMKFLGIQTWQDIADLGYEVRGDRAAQWERLKNEPYNEKYHSNIFNESDPLKLMDIETKTLQNVQALVGLGLNDVALKHLQTTTNFGVDYGETPEAIIDAYEHPKFSEQDTAKQILDDYNTVMTFWGTMDKKRKSAEWARLQKDYHQQLLDNPRILLYAPSLRQFRSMSEEQFGRIANAVNSGGGGGRSGGHGGGGRSGGHGGGGGNGGGSLDMKYADQMISDYVDLNRGYNLTLGSLDDVGNKYMTWTATGFMDSNGRMQTNSGDNPYAADMESILTANGFAYDPEDPIGSFNAAKDALRRSIGENQQKIDYIRGQVRLARQGKLGFDLGATTPQQNAWLHQKPIAKVNEEKGIIHGADGDYMEVVYDAETQAQGEAQPVSTSGNRAKHK